VATGAAFAAGFIGLGTAATAGATGEHGGAAAVTADQIAAVLSGDGVTDADFTGDANTVATVSAALAANANTDALGDSVTGTQVDTALTATIADSSDLTYGAIATDLNNAPEPVPAFTFPDGNQHAPDADVPVNAQPYSALFGAEEGPLGQTGAESIGGHNAALDFDLYNSHQTLAENFYNDVAEFENTEDHPFADLVNLLDPNAFTTQTFGTGDDAITGTLDGGGYLIPTDGFGYLATDLDFALTGTGLTYFLNPVIDLLGAGFTDLGL
jgi:hypothetical protein